MNKDEKLAMEIYGISTTMEKVYHYKEYKYKKLSDALNFAKIDSKQNTVHFKNDKHGIL